MTGEKHDKYAARLTVDSQAKNRSQECFEDPKAVYESRARVVRRFARRHVPQRLLVCAKRHGRCLQTASAATGCPLARALALLAITSARLKRASARAEPGSSSRAARAAFAGGGGVGTTVCPSIRVEVCARVRARARACVRTRACWLG